MCIARSYGVSLNFGTQMLGDEIFVTGCLVFA
jgi:hypothetical protein